MVTTRGSNRLIRRPRSLRALRARRGDARGFSLLELVAAITILAIVATGFAVSVSLGFREVALARQRQTAADLASARLEHLRSVPYTQIAVNPAPAHTTDTTNPDYYVSADGTTYDVDGEGTIETLVVDAASGGVLHLEDPVQVGATVMEIYQYVTWVDDPSIAGTEDYKRVTVAVRYKAPSVHGINRIVRATSFFGVGTVTISGTPTTVLPPVTVTIPTTTTVGATTTTADPSACPGDLDPPTGSFTLNGTSSAEAGFTAGTNVTLNLSLSDPCVPITARIRNEDGAYGEWFTYDSVNPTVSWALTTGDGSKEVDIQIADATGNTTLTSSAEIILDTTAPATPGTLTRTVSCSGSTRTVVLAWDASSDTNFRGYRIYRSTDGTTWNVLNTTTALTDSNSHSKTLDSVRFYVVGYDKAGNESAATNTISLNKNQCS